MLPPGVVESLGIAFKWGLIVLGALLVSLICSLLVEPFGEVVRDIRQSAAGFRSYLLAGPVRLLRERITAACQAYCTEFQPLSVVPLFSLGRLQLRRLQRALEQFGVPQLARLELFEKHATDHIEAIKSLPALPPPPIDGTAVADSAKESATRSLDRTLLLISLGLTLAIGLLNTFMLNIFFREALQAQGFYVLYEPIEIPTSLVLALLFAVFEVCLGLLMYVFERYDADENEAVRFLRLVPWLGIVALGLVELFAYATLSDAIGLPTRLKIDPTSRWYGLIQYFLAGFGLAITLVLALLGYMIWNTYDRYTRSRHRAHLAVAITRYSRLFDERALAAAMAENIARLREVVAEVPARLLAQFRAAIGSTEGRSTALGLVQQEFENLEHPKAAAAQSYTPAAEILLSLVLLAFSTALAYLCYMSFRTALATSGSGVLSFAGLLAFLLAAGIAVAGWLLKLVLVGSDLAPRFTTQASDAAFRVLLAVLVGLVVFGTGAFLTARNFVQNATLGGALSVNIAAGIFLPAALLAFSTFLDLYLRVAYLVAVLVVYWLALVATYVLCAATHLVEFVLFTAHVVVRFVAVPAVLIRPRSRKAGPQPVNP